MPLDLDIEYLKSRTAQLDDDELLKIAFTDSQEYQPIAVEIAREELSRRGYTVGATVTDPMGAELRLQQPQKENYRKCPNCGYETPKEQAWLIPLPQPLPKDHPKGHASLPPRPSATEKCSNCGLDIPKDPWLLQEVHGVTRKRWYRLLVIIYLVETAAMAIFYLSEGQMFLLVVTPLATILGSLSLFILSYIFSVVAGEEKRFKACCYISAGFLALLCVGALLTMLLTIYEFFLE